jgi:hypothetical protein
MAAPGRRGPGLAGGPGLLRASPARISHNGPSPRLGLFIVCRYRQPCSPFQGPLGCGVTLAPGLLPLMRHKGGRDNLDKRKIQHYEFVSAILMLRFVTFA